MIFWSQMWFGDERFSELGDSLIFGINTNMLAAVTLRRTYTFMKVTKVDLCTRVCKVCCRRIINILKVTHKTRD